MKQLADQARQGNLIARELELLKQVKAIDSESRRTEDGKILE